MESPEPELQSTHAANVAEWKESVGLATARFKVTFYELLEEHKSLRAQAESQQQTIHQLRAEKETSDYETQCELRRCMQQLEDERGRAHQHETAAIEAVNILQEEKKRHAMSIASREEQISALHRGLKDTNLQLINLQEDLETKVRELAASRQLTERTKELHGEVEAKWNTTMAELAATSLQLKELQQHVADLRAETEGNARRTAESEAEAQMLIDEIGQLKGEVARLRARAPPDTPAPCTNAQQMPSQWVAELAAIEARHTAEIDAVAKQGDALARANRIIVQQLRRIAELESLAGKGAVDGKTGSAAESEACTDSNTAVIREDAEGGEMRL